MGRYRPFGNHNRRTHGLAHTRIDNIYKAMVSRCYKPSNNRYKNYGARGIIVCPEWLNDKTKFFEWAFANGYREDLTIDRIDSDGNYEPSNCRWATYKEQENNRKNNRMLTIDGTTMTLTQWADKFGIDPKLVSNRLSRGKSPEEALGIR